MPCVEDTDSGWAVKAHSGRSYIAAGGGRSHPTRALCGTQAGRGWLFSQGRNLDSVSFLGQHRELRAKASS